MGELYGFTIQVDGNAITQINKINGGLNTLKGNSTGAMGGMAKAVGGVSSAMKGLISTMLPMMGAFAAFSFIKGGIEKVHELHAANAQLEATLKSTGNAVGFTAKQLQELSVQYKNVTKYSTAEITSMQSIMTTFTNVKGSIYKEALPAVMDLASKMGGDLRENAVRVGKALQDPERGIVALRRVGVNFNSTQVDMIKNLVASGQTMKAQKYILKELNTEFGGSAIAAANADPYFRLNKIIGSMKMSVGMLVDKLLGALLPTLISVFKMIKSGVEYLSEFGNWLKSGSTGANLFIAALWGLAAAFLALKIQIAYTTLSAKLYAWYAALGPVANVIWTASNIGLIASLKAVGMAIKNIPVVGWVVAIIAALIALVAYFYNTSAKFRAFIAGIWEAMKSIWESIKSFDFTNLGANAGVAFSRGFNKSLMFEKLDAAKKKLAETREKTAKMHEEVLAMREARKAKKAGGGLGAGANNSAALSGASGGLGEAKIINIKIDTMQKIDIEKGDSKDIVKNAPMSVELLARMINNITYSQSGTF